MNTDTDKAHAVPQMTGHWRKSSFSGDSGGCVELAPSTLGVALRDSKLGDTSPVLHFSPAEMRSLLDAAKGGDFDHLAAGVS